MQVENRIEQAPACEVINLSDAEKDIYCGAGWMLARFVDGTLVELFDPQEVEYQSDAQAMADETMDAALAWLVNAEGEVWLVMCSCCQLCEPRRVAFTDAAALAHMAKIFGEQCADY